MTQTMRPPAQAGQELVVFRACYRIAHGMPGAPTLSLQLLVDPVNKRVNGFGRITQAVHPPLDFSSQLDGQFREINVQNQRLIIVTATGYPSGHVPPAGGMVHVAPPNLQLLMVLPNNWQQQGVADYEYRINPEDPHWNIVDNVEANFIPCDGA